MTMNQVRILLSALLLLAGLTLTAQELSIGRGRFQKGDNPAWNTFSFDDNAWQEVTFHQPWEELGLKSANGIGWYRIHVVIPSSLKKGTVDAIMLDLGAIDDSDQTWVNGHLAGRDGTFPEEPGGYSSEYGKRRYYVVDPRWVNWDRDNVIAIRVYNYGDPGGLYRGDVKIVKPSLKDFAKLSLVAGDGGYQVLLNTSVKTTGTMQITVSDVMRPGMSVFLPGRKSSFSAPWPRRRGSRLGIQTPVSRRCWRPKSAPRTSLRLRLLLRRVTTVRWCLASVPVRRLFSAWLSRAKSL